MTREYSDIYTDRDDLADERRAGRRPALQEAREALLDDKRMFKWHANTQTCTQTRMTLLITNKNWSNIGVAVCVLV